MKVPRCKGSRDWLPDDMARFRRIEEIFRACCLRWGYQEIRTPTLEYLHLFTSAGTLTPELLGRVYSFLDWDGWSGERVVLRPDGTIPSARLFVENFQDLPIARLCYLENIFAFEGTGQEARERWQCGAELIGGAKPGGDAELILLALEVLNKLGIDSVEVRLSHAGLVKAILTGLGLSGEEQARLLGRIWAGDMRVRDEMEGGTLELEKPLNLLFELRGSSQGFVKNLRGIFSQSFAALEPGLNDLGVVAELLDAMGHGYQIDLASGRGFEYYTGTIFEFRRLGRRLGGGGRYDELISLVGGGTIPASGFALYVEELMNILSQEPRPLSRDRVLVRSEASDARGLKLCFEVAELLRGAGYIAELDLGCRDDADFCWVVSLRREGETPLIDLVDRACEQRLRGLSQAELLKLLEEARDQ